MKTTAQYEIEEFNMSQFEPEEMGEEDKDNRSPGQTSGKRYQFRQNALYWQRLLVRE
jgi:hypothetical protein